MSAGTSSRGWPISAPQWRRSPEDAAISRSITKVRTRSRQWPGRSKCSARARSSATLTPVFETVLQKAARLRDIYSGILWVYDGTRFHPAALHAVPPAYSDYIENPAEEAPVFADLRRGKDVVHVPDLAASCAEN